MVHHTKCPVCNCTSFSFCLRCKDYLVSGIEYDLYQCAECNFVLTQDHPDEKEIGDSYRSEDYISHSDTKRGHFNSLYHIVRSFMLTRKVQIVKRATGLKKGIILDIGSGTGYFASAMKEAGWAVIGIEVNIMAREYSIKKFGIDVLPPDAIKNISDESIDCITLWHSLEHLEGLNDTFIEIRRLLTPGGICLVALPNICSFDSEYYKQFWAGYDVPRHLWHFSIDTFRKLSDNYRFEFVGKAGLPFDAFYISILSEKNKGTNFPVARGMLTGLKSFLISVFRPEKNSSLVYLIKKNSP
jgi:SAM-dependent methyltransferase